MFSGIVWLSKGPVEDSCNAVLNLQVALKSGRQAGRQAGRPLFSYVHIDMVTIINIKDWIL